MTATGSTWRVLSSTSAISTSTASAPERWWVRIPSVGFNMSGTDSKAGGPDYLFLFTQAKSVAEKLGNQAHADGDLNL